MLGGRDPSQFSINCSDICLSSSEQIVDSSNDFGQPFLKMDLRRKWSNNPWGSGLRGKNLLLMEKFLRMAEAQRGTHGGGGDTTVGLRGKLVWSESTTVIPGFMTSWNSNQLFGDPAAVSYDNRTGMIEPMTFTVQRITSSWVYPCIET